MTDVPDLDQLSAIIDLCRKKGVETFEINGIKIALGAAPEKQTRRKRNQTPEMTAEPQYSEEDMLFWSASGVPMEGNVNG